MLVASVVVQQDYLAGDSDVVCSGYTSLDGQSCIARIDGDEVCVDGVVHLGMVLNSTLAGQIECGYSVQISVRSHHRQRVPLIDKIVKHEAIS